jgi:hypothetical protein
MVVFDSFGGGPCLQGRKELVNIIFNGLTLASGL